MFNGLQDNNVLTNNSGLNNGTINGRQNGMNSYDENVLNTKKYGIVTDSLLINVDAGDKASYKGFGNTWFDISGSGNNITNTGATYNFQNNGNFTYGTIGSFTSNAFKGVSSGSNVNNNTTNEIWVKWNGVNGSTLVTIMGNNAVAGYLGFYLNNGSGGSGNVITVIFGGQTGNAINSGISSVTLVANLWTQLVITKDTSTVRFYNNGAFLGSTTTAQSTFTTTSAYNSGSNLNLGFAICRFYNRRLTDAEVLQNFNANRTRFGL